MTTFRERCPETTSIGEVGEQWAYELLGQTASTGKYVRLDKGRNYEEFQRFVGDFVVSAVDGRMVSVEVKAEERYGPKDRYFVLETYSNYEPSWMPGDPRIKPGWFHTSGCDYLFYAFIVPGDLYVIDFPRLRLWALETLPGGSNRISGFRPFRQGKYAQKNHTCGFLAPIIEVLAGVPSRHYRYVNGKFEVVRNYPGFVAPWESF